MWPPLAEPLPRREPAEVLHEAAALRDDAADLLNRLASTRHEAAQRYRHERDQLLARELDRLPIETLKTASMERIRLGPVMAAGYTTVGSLRPFDRHQLDRIPGVGPATASQIIAAVDQLAVRLGDTVRVRLDIDRRPAGQTGLLSALSALDFVRQMVGPVQHPLAEAVAVVDEHHRPARSANGRFRRLFLSSEAKRRGEASLLGLEQYLGRPDVRQLTATVPRVREALRGQGPPADPWQDYLARPVQLNGLLNEIGGLDDRPGSHGHLPGELVDRIQAFRLDTSLLDVSLRGYQSFGAKFALVQGRSILGDEMGLGKTIEALAVLAHLTATGRSRSLVVSPASVLANWRHETQRHTRMERRWLLHGPDRDEQRRRWEAQGGVAFTTFGTLRSLGEPLVGLDALVVDEAHYVKNPEAQRTMAVRRWIERADTVLLMSGTPMENRVEEFRTLVEHIRPDVANRIRVADGMLGAAAFRRNVAEVYLRRNQADVLDELPERIETEEWSTLDGPAAEAYRDAVVSGNFMAMRRAAFLTPAPLDSPKLERLVEIVDEAMLNDRKVVVFSFFRDVLDRVHDALGQKSAGQLTGSVAPDARQRLVDEFSALPEPAVLVAQIEAGGVGLNLQAASVVILAEPQWKPSTEAQAIARCQRLGQVRTVEVHRLLTEDSVDEHMVAVLAGKSELFARYAHRSILAESTPAAVDVTDAAAVARVIDQAAVERRIVDAERHRLGVHTVEP